VEILIFWTLFSIAIVFTIIAVWKKNFGFVGIAAALLMLMGTFGIVQGLDYKTGEAHTYVLTEECIPDMPAPGITTCTTTGTIVITDTKTTQLVIWYMFGVLLFGFLLVLLGAFRWIGEER